MSEQRHIRRKLELPSGQPVRVGDIPRLWAAALHEDEFARAAAEESLWRCLNADVHSGNLVPLSASSLTRHEFPVGEALRRAVVMPESLRPMLEQAGIDLVLVEPGNGPDFWSIENAARDIGEILGWSRRQVETLCGQMLDAAQDGALMVRHPHTELPVPLNKRATVRAFYELVTRVDVNVWLVRIDAPFRWVTYEQAATQPRYIAGRLLWRLPDAIEHIAAMPDFGVSATALKARVQSDAEKGKMTLRDQEHGAEIQSDWGAIVLSWCLYAEDFNAWLEAAGYPEPYRLPTVDAVASPAMSGASTRPRFVMPANPIFVDTELLAIEPSSEVSLITSLCGRCGEAVGKAKDAIEAIQAVIRRQAKGHFTLEECAEIMALAHGFRAIDFLKNRLLPAFDSGALRLIDPEDGGPVNGRQCRDFYDWVTPANLDSWLEAEGFSIRWPLVPEQAHQVTEEPPASPVNHKPAQLPLQVFPAQESALLREIQEAGYTAKALPRIKAGRPGVKSEIRARLKDHRLFIGVKKFDKAWDRLLAAKEIGYNSSPALG